MEETRGSHCNLSQKSLLPSFSSHISNKVFKSRAKKQSRQKEKTMVVKRHMQINKGKNNEFSLEKGGGGSKRALKKTDIHY